MQRYLYNRCDFTRNFNCTSFFLSWQELFYEAQEKSIETYNLLKELSEKEYK